MDDLTVAPADGGEAGGGLRGWRGRLKERYPGEEPADDEGWDALALRFADESDAEIGKYKGVEGKMTELCRVYPEFGELVYDLLVNRLPLRAAIAKLFSQEELIPQEGDDDYEAFRRSYAERLRQAEKREEQAREIGRNEARSIEAIDAFCSGKGLAEAQKEEFIGLINDHFTELLYKRISPSMLEGFLKQLRYDEAVAEAGRTGELRGRNVKIEAVRVKERARETGDGMPGSGGGGGAMAQVAAPRRRSAILDARDAFMRDKYDYNKK